MFKQIILVAGLLLASCGMSFADFNPGAFTAPPLVPSASSSLNPILYYLTPKMFGAKCDGTTDDSTALQALETAAVANHANIRFPVGTCKFSTTLTTGEGVVHQGYGIGNSVLQYTGSGWAFTYITPNGVVLTQAPDFYDFTLNTPSAGAAGGGIKYNDVTHGFTDDASSQYYMIQPIVWRVQFNGPNSAAGSIGIQCSKCFDASFKNNWFNYYAIGVDIEGSDNSAISDNGMYYAATEEIKAVSHGTFGSELVISHNDMPFVFPTANAFIYFNYDSGWIEYNHIENDSSTLPTLIAVQAGRATGLTIHDNSISNLDAGTPCWLTVSGNLFVLDARNNNENGGPTPKPACFNSGLGALYFYSNFYRQIITSNGNTDLNTGFPFNSIPQNVNTPASYLTTSQSVIWDITPNTSGLTNSDAGLTIYVKNGAFVIPPSASSAVSYTDYQGPTTLPAGVDVWVCGYAGTNGQTITVLNGAGAPTQALTTTNTCYKVFNNTTFIATVLAIQNADTVTNSNAFITEIKVLIH